MASAGGRDEGEARTAADETAHSSSGGSDHEDDEIATISDVFADMLIANEDLLHAAAEYQLESDVPSILAYQRILHRNLIEMADFVDSAFGVYNKLDLSDSTAVDVMEDEHEGGDEEKDQEPLVAEVHDDANGHTSEESSDQHAKAKTAKPVRMRSLLIDRFRLENKRRMEQRTARLWRKMRRKVRVEEGVSVVMTQAVERIAQMTVSAAAARDSSPSAKPSKPSNNDVSPMSTPSTTPGQVTQLSQPNPQHISSPVPAPVPDATTVAAVAPPDPSTTEKALAQSVTANPRTLHQAPLPQPALSMSLLTSSLPFAQQGNAMLVPAGANSFTKVPLPPMSSGLSMFYPMPVPTMFPPNHMSSVCADCVPLNRTAHECRSILKHITPPPPTVQPMMMAAPPMWPLAFNGVVAAQQPMRSVPPMRSTQPAASAAFKKMCEECKKNHKSVHHCRKILGHTAPEWLSGMPESEPKPRKRRSRRQKEMDEAAQRLASSANVQTQTVNGATSSTTMSANEI